jgi:hypothetical protein
MSKVAVRDGPCVVFVFYSGHAYTIEGKLYAIPPCETINRWINLNSQVERFGHSRDVLTLSLFDCSRMPYQLSKRESMLLLEENSTI